MDKLKYVFFGTAVLTLAFCTANKKNKLLEKTNQTPHLTKQQTYDSLLGFVEYNQVPFLGFQNMLSLTVSGKEYPLNTLEKNTTQFYLPNNTDTTSVYCKLVNPALVAFKNSGQNTVLSIKQKGFVNGKPTLVEVELHGLEPRVVDDTAQHMLENKTILAKVKRKALLVSVFVTEFSSNANAKLIPQKRYLVNPMQLNEVFQLSANPKTDVQSIVVDKKSFDLYYFENGKCIKQHKAGWGQNPDGHKQKQGDNRTPEGEYFITKKVMGPFTGGGSEFLGYAYMELNYPNVKDAKLGLQAGKITQTQYAKIIQANKAKTVVPKQTKLGGAVGLHGWISDFTQEGALNMTFGCVCMLNTHMQWLYKTCNMGTKVYIY